MPTSWSMARRAPRRRLAVAVAVAALVCIAAACASPVSPGSPAHNPRVIAPNEMNRWPATAPDAFGYNNVSGECTGGMTSGASYVLIYLAYYFSPTTTGGYNCRANTADPGELSLHAVGRAMDLHFNAYNASEASRADLMVFWLLSADEAGHPAAAARRMGIQEIIWNRRVWTSNRPNEGMRPYTGPNPHTDHVHIGVNMAASLQATSFFQGWNVLSCAPHACGYIPILTYSS